MILRAAIRPLAVWGLLGLAGLPLPAQPQEGQPQEEFSGETRVTAADVVVDVVRRQTLLSESREPSRNLGPQHFEILLDGRPVPLVGVEGPGQSPERDDAEPWSLVVYLEPTLHGDLELRWAAGLLMEEAEALAALGTVHIVVADPRPRTVLEPTRDVDAIEEALSSLALEAEGDNALTTLREAVLAAGDEEDLDPEDLDPGDLAALETSLVRERLDIFLLHLVQNLPATARRAVFPLGLGFDPRPETFYLEEGDEPTEASGRPVRGVLAKSTQDLAQALAAYGWVALPVASPLPGNRAKIRPGKRIGKFRFTWGNDMGLPGFSAAYEEDRDPEKAEAHYQVGRQLVESGDLEEATESFRKAIFHYYGDPRTSEGQIRTYQALGETLEALGDVEGARRAFEAARDLKDHPKVVARQQREAEKGPPPAEPEADPGAEARADAEADAEITTSPEDWLARPAGATDIDPGIAFEILADATAGRPLRKRWHLEDALESLGRRYRLTYQLEFPPADPEKALPPGHLRELTVRSPDPALEIAAPTHARSGAPEAVAAARLRQLVTSALPDEAGDLDAEDVEEAGDLDPATARIVIDLEGQAQPGDALRLSYAQAGDEGDLHIRHLPLPAEALETGSYTLELPRDEDRPGLVLLLDNLTANTWAATILEL